MEDGERALMRIAAAADRGRSLHGTREAFVDSVPDAVAAAVRGFRGDGGDDDEQEDSIEVGFSGLSPDWAVQEVGSVCD